VGPKHSRRIIIIAIRTACIVLGISALALLVQKLVGVSGVGEWLIMRQLSLPGALYFVEALETLTYGIVAIAVAYGVARAYWRELFPARFSTAKFAICAAAGLLFAVFLNHPAHQLLFNLFYGKPMFTGGTVSETVLGGLFANMTFGAKLLTMQALATILLSPFVEELTDRGILFAEMFGQAVWQAAFLSFAIFCFSHFAIGGMAKVLAVMPSAMLFIGLRLWSGSFLYSFAAHAALNAAALLKFQMF
jgi:Type II CAAX prenyl endopeptidase Rce1-like